METNNREEITKEEHLTDGTPCWCNPKIIHVKPTYNFVRFTQDGFDHTSYGEEIPYYVSPWNKLLDFILGHKWIRTDYKVKGRKNEIRCDRCWEKHPLDF